MLKKNYKNKILGKNIFLEKVKNKDYHFIYYLRRNRKINKFIHKISKQKKKQLLYLKSLKKNEIYFLIKIIKNNKRIGTISITDIDYKKKKGTIGRWVLKQNYLVAFESFFLALKYSFLNLKLNKVYCNVENKNVKAIAFQKSIRSKEINFKKNKIILNKKKCKVIKFEINKKIFLTLKKERCYLLSNNLL